MHLVSAEPLEAYSRWLVELPLCLGRGSSAEQYSVVGPSGGIKDGVVGIIQEQTRAKPSGD